MYLMVATRPGLVVVVGVLSQFEADLYPTTWQALERVLGYLQATRTQGFEPAQISIFRLYGYSKAD